MQRSTSEVDKRMDKRRTYMSKVSKVSTALVPLESAAVSGVVPDFLLAGCLKQNAPASMLQRNDSRLAVGVVALFLGPAVLILLLAYSTGFLDSMYTNSLSTFRT